MYPIRRFALEIMKSRRQPRLAIGETHVARFRCMPWDIDPWRELNNGRTLTLFDLGRIGIFVRSGIVEALRERGWIGTVLGGSVRYRRRFLMFQKLELRTRLIGWDAKFVYCEQGFWARGECASHALLRLGVVGSGGLVPTGDLAEAIGVSRESPPLPEWVEAWAAADAKRPWPPEDLSAPPES